MLDSDIVIRWLADVPGRVRCCVGLPLARVGPVLLRTEWLTTHWLATHWLAAD